MAFEVIAWNIKERLGHAEYQTPVFEQLRREMAEKTGAVVLSEVCREKPLPVDEVYGKLAEFAGEEGFEFHWAEYDDDTPRRGVPENYRQHLAVLSRLDNVATETIGLGGRNAITVAFKYEDVPVTITGMHFDDRTELIRLDQAGDYVDRAFVSDTANVLAGDLNALHGSSVRARAIRAVRPATKAAAVRLGVPVEADRSTPLEALRYKAQRTANLAARMGGMAAGTTMQLLEVAGFQDVDPERRPTHLAGQLDHIMYEPALHKIDFRLGEKGPSDHRLISATFAV